jgi:hypothetical protein
MIRLSFVVAGLALAATAQAHAAPTSPHVLALVVTNNHSPQSGRPELHYADDDGAKYYDLFRMRAADDDVELLTDFDRDSRSLFPVAQQKAHSPTVAEVRAAVTRLATRVHAATAAGEKTELYFVFAGHGDVDHGRGFLELRDGRITSEDLEGILHDIGATQTHVILDSCNSFFVLSPRKPGGRQIEVTEQAAQSLSARLPTVGVMLSTSAEAEVFEWSELQSGIFSHAVRSGLAGAADANGDGTISYDELRAFVDIASARIKNPLYRPKVFAHAPGGNGATAIFDGVGATARRIAVAAGPSRLTVRDPSELPWIDINLEPGAATTLLLPTAWAEGATVEVRAADGSVARRALPTGESKVELAALEPATTATAARGRDEMLSDLFAAPFGPHAYAAWQDETQHAAPPVYGVSSDDAERMRLLLAQVASSERFTRRIGGTAVLLMGAALATEPLWGYGDESTRTQAFEVVAGSAIGALGLAGLFKPSGGEWLYRNYVRSMANPRADQARVVAATEERLEALADHWRFQRKLWFGMGVAVGAIGVTGVVAATQDSSLSSRDRTTLEIALGGTAALGLVMAVAATHETPVEQMRELWRSDPDLSRMPRVQLSVAPVRGGAGLGLLGSF